MVIFRKKEVVMINKKTALISILALTACGTIFNGTSQDVSFDSNVKGVTIYINGVKACKTPCVYPIDRSSSTVVAVAKKDGYEDQQQVLKSSLSTASILNLTFWPSWLTDVATGGMWQYSREGVYIDMEKPATKHAELQKIKQDVAARRFALYNYGELKIEAAKQQNGEYVTALSALTQQDPQKVRSIINQSGNEVHLAHLITGIE